MPIRSRRPSGDWRRVPWPDSLRYFRQEGFSAALDDFVEYLTTEPTAALSIGDVLDAQRRGGHRIPARERAGARFTRRLVLHRRTAAPADRCNAGDISTPAPHKPALSRGETRGSQVPGSTSSGVPWSSTPPGAYRPSPISRCGRRRLQAIRGPRHPGSLPISGLPTHGPHARVPAQTRSRTDTGGSSRVSGPAGR